MDGVFDSWYAVIILSLILKFVTVQGPGQSSVDFSYFFFCPVISFVVFSTWSVYITNGYCWPCDKDASYRAGEFVTPGPAHNTFGNFPGRVQFNNSLYDRYAYQHIGEMYLRSSCDHLEVLKYFKNQKLFITVTIPLRMHPSIWFFSLLIYFFKGHLVFLLFLFPLFSETFFQYWVTVTLKLYLFFYTFLSPYYLKVNSIPNLFNKFLKFLFNCLLNF